MSKFAALQAALQASGLLDEAAEEDARNAAILAGTVPAQTGAQRQKARRQKRNEERESNIAVLDMETDPFDSLGQERISPFAACLASDHFSPIEIWDENPERFISKVLEAIESLPGAFTIYAHNGGKFDYLFLVHKLRGKVSFKGRGIMAAKIGPHELRDSFHILPEKLAAYKKDAFDYEKMRKGNRHKHKREIQQYLVNDCIYLLDFVKAFIAENGLKLSIGQAAISAVKENGINVESINEGMDAYLRQFYFGGRVECLEGMGEFHGDYKLYDVNSMYPAVMARHKHPVGRDYIVRRGKPGPHTFFIDLSCVNHGAFVRRDADGNTVATERDGQFRVSIYEYNVAIKYNLIEDVKIHYCVDSLHARDFSAFVTPAYQKRQEYKEQMRELKKLGKENTDEFLDTKIRDILQKFYCNNSYGKYAQNPRKYKESYITSYGCRPPSSVQFDLLCDDQEWNPDELEAPAHWVDAAVEINSIEWGLFPVFENAEQNYAIWEKPVEKLRFKNVGTSASITGAARAVLLEAICNAGGAIYCDTDSLLCKTLENVEFHPSTLGAWDLEAEFATVRIAGKKLYACRKADGTIKSASKGVRPPTWDEFGAMLDGATLEMIPFAPTITKRQTQDYVPRRIRVTARGNNRRLIERTKRHA